MHFTEAVQIAALSLWAHKMRSLLTLIGVVIGITAVISLVSLIEGANRYVATKVVRLGADVFIVRKDPTIIDSPALYLEVQKRRRFTFEDYEAVRDTCQSCKEVGATFNDGVEVKSGLNSVKDSNLRAWTPQMASLNNVDLSAGRHLTETDLRVAAPVCVVGSDIVDNLLPNVDPIGKEILWKNTPCQIIGVGEKQGSSLGESMDNWIIVPWSTYNKEFGSQKDSLRIFVRSSSTSDMQQSVDEVRQIMRNRHHLAYDAKDDFATETSATFLDLWKTISGSFAVVTVGIASISLVVGGIVIMNIMLVSVTERTREIGLRKAIGARRGDIMTQFLIESSTIAAIGGILGITCGIVLAKIVSMVSPLPSAVKLWSVLCGLAVALSVGLFFGTYPASKAAKLDPVDALRAE
jgi:putative ABC transport system permease protein